MKKIFTLMLAMVCAMFVGVSCSSNSGLEGGGTGTTYDVVINVEQPAEFDAAGAEGVELVYSLSKSYAGEFVTIGEPSAFWLTVELTDDEKILLSALPYNAAGVAPRQATFTLSYKNAADVTVTVSQKSQAPTFAVAWSNQTPLGATGTISVIDPDKQDMVWGAFSFGQSSLMQGGGVGPLSADAELMDPVEYADQQLTMLADPMMGMGGLWLGFYQMAQYGPGYLLSENGINTMDCSLYGWMGVEEKMYIAIIGINKNVDLDNYIDNSTRATAVHVFEVANLAQPKVVVEALNKVAYTEGTLALDVTIDNPYGEAGVISVEGSNLPQWLTATYENGKVNIAYTQNDLAKARVGEFTVVYTYNCPVTQYGETMEMSVPATTTVKVEQAANPNVEPVTFTITVKETHFDRIIVDVVPSDSKAYYILGAQTKNEVDYYAKYGGWDAICEYDLGNDTHQGSLKDHVISINTKWAEDEGDWTYFVYAFQTDANASMVAGAPTYVSTPVVNDSPQLQLNHSELVYNAEENQYTLTVYGKGGDYSIPFEVLNAVEGYKVRLNDYPYTDHKLYADSDVLDANTELVIDNDAKTINFKVKDYPADWSNGWNPYQDIGLLYSQVKADGSYTSTTLGKAISLNIILKPAQ